LPVVPLLDRPVSPRSPTGQLHGTDRGSLEAGRGFARGRLAFCTVSLFDPLALDPDTSRI
jgi:hypothetical protein